MQGMSVLALMPCASQRCVALSLPAVTAVLFTMQTLYDLLAIRTELLKLMPQPQAVNGTSDDDPGQQGHIPGASKEQEQPLQNESSPVSSSKPLPAGGSFPPSAVVTGRLLLSYLAHADLTTIQVHCPFYITVMTQSCE